MSYLVTEDDPAGFRWVRLNRPDRRNALDEALAAELRDALRTDPQVPLLLGSTDPGVFCAGADRTVPAAERSRVSQLVYRCCEAMLSRPAPVIAVVTGAAVGGGAQLAAAADLRIGGPSARLRWTGPPETRLVVGAWLLPDLVGRSVAMDLLMTGRWRTFGARTVVGDWRGQVLWSKPTEAARLGFFVQLAEDPEAAAATLAMAVNAAPALKAVMTEGLIGRLHAEENANREAWTRVR